MNQIVSTLKQPILSNEFGPPLVIRTVTPKANPNFQTEHGAMESQNLVSEYILLNALPAELRERVITAIKMLAIV